MFGLKYLPTGAEYNFNTKEQLLIFWLFHAQKRRNSYILSKFSFDNLNVTGKDKHLAPFCFGTYFLFNPKDTVYELRSWLAFEQIGTIRRIVDIKNWEREQNLTLQNLIYRNKRTRLCNNFRCGPCGEGARDHSHRNKGLSQWKQSKLALEDIRTAELDELPIYDHSKNRKRGLYQVDQFEIYEKKYFRKWRSSKSWKDQTHVRKQWQKHLSSHQDFVPELKRFQTTNLDIENILRHPTLPDTCFSA